MLGQVAGVSVRVPASTANLGPGYDVLAAALDVYLEVRVRPAEAFAVDAGGLAVPEDRDNLVVRAFERLHPAEGLGFTIRSDIPLDRGLGSSGAAIVAGLLAADRLGGLELTGDDLLLRAAELEGHPDNVGASLLGGIVIVTVKDGMPRAERIEVPEAIEAIVVVPGELVSTEEARRAIPDQVSTADAVANLGSVALLALGLARADGALIARGLADRLHQPRRAHLYPRSLELVAMAPSLGALGATISGAGPTVLVWAWRDRAEATEAAVRDWTGEWAEVERRAFAAAGGAAADL